ncbi:MAG: fluoride efflux transporter CrcB [Planctomycetota bacterium]|nr:MAG: fluoride efflux transporter CrcB [Planctomycetota bacterium]
MLNLLIVGLGGFLGAIARFGVSSFLAARPGPGFPFGTLLVNVLGCLAIGALMALLELEALSANLRLFLAVGLLGSFTTFSTFGYETIELLRDGAYQPALWNVAGSLVLGLCAVLLGRALVHLAG